MPYDPRITLKEFLRTRVQNTNAEIAKYLGITPAYFSMILNGKRNFQPDQKEKLIQLIGTKTNPDQIIFPDELTGATVAPVASDEDAESDRAVSPYLLAFLKARGWSVRKLAKAINLDRDELRRILAGRPVHSNLTDMCTIGAISRAIGVDTDHIPWSHPSQKWAGDSAAKFGREHPEMTVERAFEMLHKDLRKSGVDPSPPTSRGGVRGGQNDIIPPSCRGAR
ncbi:MAG: helix-turn-helix transcriptional regulator [Candidatus Electryoneaceae bacterium]|nr:helix-turn-helix transcriptional regulator [Candidatus Electryoneaceae bacterium]